MCFHIRADEGAFRHLPRNYSPVRSGTHPFHFPAISSILTNAVRPLCVPCDVDATFPF